MLSSKHSVLIRAADEIDEQKVKFRAEFSHTWKKFGIKTLFTLLSNPFHKIHLNPSVNAVVAVPVACHFIHSFMCPQGIEPKLLCIDYITLKPKAPLNHIKITVLFVPTVLTVLHISSHQCDDSAFGSVTGFSVMRCVLTEHTSPSSWWEKFWFEGWKKAGWGNEREIPSGGFRHSDSRQLQVNRFGFHLLSFTCKACMLESDLKHCC